MERKENKAKIALKHFQKICVHKYWVFKYCRIYGITWRGIKHDLSKFSLVEFLESIKYYVGTSSPINECKRINGVSYAWMHHKGRNDHHYEYWQDNFDNGGNPIDMPFECSVEMLCDYLGAARAYLGDRFTYIGEYKWFIDKLNKPLAMHIHTKVFIYFCLEFIASLEHNNPNPEEDLANLLSTSTLHRLYNNSKQYTEESFEKNRKALEDRKWVKNDV